MQAGGWRGQRTLGRRIIILQHDIAQGSRYRASLATCRPCTSIIIASRGNEVCRSSYVYESHHVRVHG